MNKQELIEYCESLKGDLNKFINRIDVNKIVKKDRTTRRTAESESI